MKKNKILIVEDDEDIRALTALYLEKKGYEVEGTGKGLDAIEKVKKTDYELILLDVMLPGIHGFDVCKKMRERTESPIIFLSSKRSSEDKIAGLNAGGDDYLTKPYDLDELEARIKANLRRGKNEPEQHLITGGPLTVNTGTYEVHKNNQKISLYAKEFQLLEFLMKNKGRVYSAEQIYDRIWGNDSFGDLKTVTVHIRNLRKKIEDNPHEPLLIKTIRGFGYKFEKN
ncbi:response regulator transcription factor [Alkalicoccus halolimnae]|uniref:Response regulator transcription factor n=1 Tax=Alkalicoccus halolimnae TaxID=1667239 RepID=A0A5C7F929_9BACI|nr:response regulator transcription factor [Alkalicoccus halolimnae]TXF86110.1 response regulator transcription factor [Alkalicoccus halolimnae]